ncbi:hypothetical protein [Absidia glauca]|uniref:Uncharacterized protein n=1 Tax=Absidia glauca TaxID=4829 RepID=A0A168MTQ4_ABSGL|nr:hypothetical protein [Absidia glauca]
MVPLAADGASSSVRPADGSNAAYKVISTQAYISVTKAEKQLDDMDGNLDVCYLTDPTIPLFVLKERINGALFTFEGYLSTREVDVCPREDQPLLETTKQVTQFIELVYVSREVMDKELYSLSLVTMKDIFATVLQNSNCMEGKTLNGVASFCGKNKLGFLDAVDTRKKRKVTKTTGQRYRQLHVLKQEYYKTTTKSIVGYQDRSRRSHTICCSSRAQSARDSEPRDFLARPMISKPRCMDRKWFMSASSANLDYLQAGADILISDKFRRQ